MPHPDYRIADVPLRLDQVDQLIRLVDRTVAEHGRQDVWTPVMAALVGSLPTDTPHLRPGPEHWLWAELKRETSNARL